MRSLGLEFSLAMSLSVAGMGHAAPPAHPAAAPAVHRAFVGYRAEGGAAIFGLNRAEWDLAAQQSGPVLLTGFPLPGAGSVDLELERFRVLAPGTRVRMVDADGVERDMDLDPEAVVLLRGRAVGHPASRIVLAIAPSGSTARIDLGPGSGRYLVTDRAGEGYTLKAGELAVVAARAGGALSLPVGRCGLAPALAETPVTPSDQPAVPAPAPDPRGVGPLRGLRHLQLAVDTDYEYFELFDGDSGAAATYLLQLYGIVSDIFIRDTGARVELTMARIWTTPADPYNGPESDFFTRLQAQVQGVPRDAAQLFTGRNDLSAGGVATGVGNICTAGALSWAGYAQGRFFDPDRPHWTNGDIIVTAHELGHNAGSGHTHDYGLDTCQTGNPPARRGSIMSYCGQGYNGDDANHDAWFHEHTANLIRTRYMQTSCVALDCNANGVSDATDINSGGSADLNTNGVPDECEDCNGNGVLDPLEISSGSAGDVNGNLIPDSCENDCNGNGVPDAHETSQSPAIDLNRNRIPDSCEPDCDADGVADYNEIQGNMALDIDRNLILDSCQRCIPDGPTDAAALDHAWNVYAGTRDNAGVGEFHALSGVRVRADFAAEIAGTNDLIIMPDRRILVSSPAQNRVALVSPAGQHLGTFIPGGSGGLSQPAGMALSPAGTLLVVSRGTSAVLEYDAQTGAFIRALVQPGAGGLTAPFGLGFGPSGHLFVSSGSNQVFEYDGATGAFVRIFVTAAANGGLSDPRGLLFKPDDGSLLVCSYLGGDVLRYDGTSGAPLGRWNRNGPGTALDLENPWCIRLGPDGDIYVSRAHALRSGEPLHLTNVRIFQFGARLGNYQRAFVSGRDSGLDEPTGFDFMPGDATDCNLNYLPDACDIAQGTSHDRNQNARPDECDCLADWNSSGSVDSTDVSAFLTAWLASLTGGTLNGDFNGDGTVNSADISAFLVAWLDGVTNGC